MEVIGEGAGGEKEDGGVTFAPILPADGAPVAADKPEGLFYVAVELAVGFGREDLGGERAVRKGSGDFLAEGHAQ